MSDPVFVTARLRRDIGDTTWEPENRGGWPFWDALHPVIHGRSLVAMKYDLEKKLKFHGWVLHAMNLSPTDGTYEAMSVTARRMNGVEAMKEAV